ncbi:MAG: hypothetical protein ABIR68_08305 [Ilumatobacteraceae bacterium]
MNDHDLTDDKLVDAVADAFDRPVPAVDPERVSAVRAAAARAQAATPGSSAALASGDDPPALGEVRSISSRTRGPSTSRRTVVIGGIAAAIGAVGGVVGANLAVDDPTPVATPPTEPITWQAGSAAPTDAAVAGRLINHTWGVELLLDATGFPVGTGYRVAYVGADGSSTDAGGFVGAELPIHCRCNGPRLRAEVAAIEIRDPTGAVVERAELA